MRRKLLLPALAACSMFAISAPVASATTHKAHASSLGSKLSAVSGALKGLQKAVGFIKNVNSGQTAAIHSVDVRVDTVVANLDALGKKVDAITAAATAALTQINAALTDETTGLVGLNHARPQFGAYDSSGVFLGGTGAVTGASGPKANVLGASGTGIYVVDFGNDVSKRFLSVTPNPTTAGTAPPVGQAVNCSSAPTSCGPLQGVGSDASVNHVLVKFGTGAAADQKPANGFSVAAISG